VQKPSGEGNLLTVCQYATNTSAALCSVWNEWFSELCILYQESFKIEFFLLSLSSLCAGYGHAWILFVTLFAKLEHLVLDAKLFQALLKKLLAVGVINQPVFCAEWNKSCNKSDSICAWHLIISREILEQGVDGLNRVFIRNVQLIFVFCFIFEPAFNRRPRERVAAGIEAAHGSQQPLQSSSRRLLGCKGLWKPGQSFSLTRLHFLCYPQVLAELGEPR